MPIQPDAPARRLPAVDVAIIGAGAAGMSAATMLAAAGLRLAVIDEQQRWGGQILRQPPAAFRIAAWLPGAGYRALKRQLQRAEQLEGVRFQGGTSVVGLFPADDGEGFDLWLSSDQDVVTLTARRVLLAPGCYDLPVPLPGWTLPGVMTVGGLQAFVKAQQLLPGDAIVLAGSHPLQLILARQILAAGGNITALLFAQPWTVALRLLREPLLLLQNWRPLCDAGLALLALRRAGVSVRFGHIVVAALGEDRLTAVAVARVDAAGKPGPASATLSCDALGLGFGFLPQAELARLAGADARWDAPTGGWAVQHDAWMQTARPGLFVAGEITGVAGAAAAMLQGKLAAQGILLDSGRQQRDAAEQLARPWRRRHRRLRRFAARLADLAWSSDLLDQLVTPETILCRCELVRAGAIDAFCAGLPEPVRDASAVKLACRIGMGLCQGRQCESSLLRRMAARQGLVSGQIQGFTPRFPAKPVLIEDLVDFDR